MLTKSDLQAFLQCPRKLWLEHFRPQLLPSDESGLSRRAMDGVIVGSKAREQLGSECLPLAAGNSDRASFADEARRQLLANPDKSAAEVPLCSTDLYTRADALIPNKGSYKLQETKASTFPLKKDKLTPGDPKEHHLDDVAIQAWLMDSSLIPAAALELNLLNSQWRYPGEGDYSGLFRQMDVTGEANARKSNVPIWLADARQVLAGPMPAASLGKHCAEPYDCPFQRHCEPWSPPAPQHPIELLPGSAGKALARKLRASKGYTSLLEPSVDELEGPQASLYCRIQEAHRTGNLILEPGAAEKLSALGYPRYFFDFEGIDFPVPQWKGFRPYEHAPFQWSCHIERAPGQFVHAEFLDLTGDDPSLPCIEEMRQVINPYDLGPIIIYNAVYERQRLRDLAVRHPEHAELLDNFDERLVDLLPIVQAHLYHPDMRGSFSIKNVLPVVAPDLDYSSLDEIQEGTAAQVAYLLATKDPSTTPSRKIDLEKKLRAYCQQDTWAMVEVAYFLAGAGRPTRPL